MRPAPGLLGKHPVSRAPVGFFPFRYLSSVRSGSVPPVSPFVTSVARIFPGRISLKESHELTRYYCCRPLRRRLGASARHGGATGPLHRRHRPHRRRGGFSVQRNEASSSPTASQGRFSPLRGHRFRPRPTLRYRTAFLCVPPLRCHLRLGH